MVASEESKWDLKLKDKGCADKGSTAGIGFAIAESLAGEGACVYVNGRTQVRVDAATTAIRSHTGSKQGRGRCRGLRKCGGRGSTDREATRGRCAGEQCRHLRAEAAYEYSRRRLVSVFQGKRDERDTPIPALSFRVVEEEPLWFESFLAGYK